MRTKARLHVFGHAWLAAGLEQKPDLPLCKCSLSGNSERARQWCLFEPELQPWAWLARVAKHSGSRANTNDLRIRRNLIQIKSKGWICAYLWKAFLCIVKTKIWFVITHPHKIECCYIIVGFHFARSITHMQLRLLSRMNAEVVLCSEKKQMKTQCHHEQNFSVLPALTGSARVFLSHTFFFFKRVHGFVLS